MYDVLHKNHCFTWNGRLVEQKMLADIEKIVAMFSPFFIADGRQFHEELERDGGSRMQTKVQS